jgi:hypothetical protein
MPALAYHIDSDPTRGALHDARLDARHDRPEASARAGRAHPEWRAVA